MARSIRAAACALCIVVSIVGSVAAQGLPTPGEAVGFTRYTQNEAIARFLSRLDGLSAELNVQIVGRSEATGTTPAEDLYLCIVTEEGVTSPHELDRSKPTLFLFASQHGNEQSAKEAALALVRDLAIGDLRELLRQVNVLVMPQVNPYGNRVDRRRNERELDLNRDHVKLEAPATVAVHRVFREWMPEVTVDAHEKGDDYYRVSYGCVSNPNVDRRLQEYSRSVLLVEVAAALEAEGIAFHEYLVTQPIGLNSASGAALPVDAGEGRERMKRYSTTDLNDGRNGLGIYQTASFILEGASRHDLETLGERTGWQRAAMREMTKAVARHGEEITALVAGLRRQLLDRARRVSEEDRVHLRMEYARSPEEPTLTLRQLESSEAPILGVLKGDKAAAEAVTRDDLGPYPLPAEQRVVEEVVEHWFPLVRPTLSVVRPLGYFIPRDHRAVVETLLRHRIRVEMLVRDGLLPVEAYEVTRVVPAELDYLAPSEIEVVKRDLSVPIAAGSFFVPVDQEAASLVPALLEPQSEYGLIRYRQYGLVPEQGELFPFYRWIGGDDPATVPYKAWRW